MFSAFKRTVDWFVDFVKDFTIGISGCLSMLVIMFGGLAMLMWLFGAGGIFEIFRTIISTAEAGFKHDWKMSEVVLVLLILFLMVRKR